MNSARVLAATLLIPALQAPVNANNLATLPSSESVLVLERTSRQLSRTGDPIWNLRLESPGEATLHFEAVTGRAHRQNADRHVAGTRAPLPAGRYSLGPVEPLGPQDPSELGPVWIGIEPLFRTGRGHLGIHLDPSANRNANSGTLGCVGLIRRSDMLKLADLIERRNVQALVVND
mgnify:FL=1|jgi:hypothetical protein